VAKPPGTFRIVTLGDSYTWGDKIALTEDTWPARLESILEAGARDVDIEVVNLAEAGFTTANEVELMSRLGWQFGPDLVLIQFLVNDAFPSWPGLGRVGSAEVFGSYRLLPARFAGAAAGRSALVAYLEKELNALLQDVDYEPLYEEDAEGWAQLQAAIRQLGRDAADRSVPVVMLLMPRFVPGVWTAESHPDRTIHERVASAATRAGLRVLDVTRGFGAGGIRGEDWWATPYDGHPNEAAHAIIAEQVARFVADSDVMVDQPAR
jgi:lysophospholipase L1-like esterase